MPKLTKPCRCGHRRSDHKVRQKQIGKFTFHRFYNECDWRNCSCRKFKEDSKLTN